MKWCAKTLEIKTFISGHSLLPIKTIEQIRSLTLLRADCDIVWRSTRSDVDKKMPVNIYFKIHHMLWKNKTMTLSG